jgi:hypothetical protein
MGREEEEEQSEGLIYPLRRLYGIGHRLPLCLVKIAGKEAKLQMIFIRQFLARLRLLHIT